jgi:hypothetical protein
MRKLLFAFGLVATVLATATAASAASVSVSPASATAGATVTVSGDVNVNGKPGCQVPGTVFLTSAALVQGTSLPVDATGHFSGSVTLLSSVAAGSYTIGGRCGGGNLGVTATLTVTGLPRTGSSPLPLELGLGCLGAGALALLSARQRASLPPRNTRETRAPHLP